jgi:predicted MPP superfamily phosphohydrolase
VNRKKGAFLISFCIVLSLFVYGVWIEPNYMVEIKHLSIENDAFKKALNGKTAIHISDLHISKIGAREKKILSIIENINPDLIFLTGDFVHWKGGYRVALEFLSRLKADLGVWAVMGDSDYSNSRKSCLFCHKERTGKPTELHNIRFLRNSVEQISILGNSIWIGGIDESTWWLFDEDMELPSLYEKTPAILLCHSPLTFDLLDEGQVVLMLSGDTHGGQISLPKWLWRILGYEKNFRYNRGLFRKGRIQMYVNRGVGTSHFPIRLFSRPELLILHF